MISPLLNEHEVAARLGVSHRSLQKWRVTGSPLPFIKIGNCVRYDERDVLAFIEAQRRRSTSDQGEVAA